MALRTLLAAFTCVLVGGACSVTPGELTTGFPDELPGNADIVVFARTPIDVRFERVDRGAPEVLTHTTVGDGFEDVALVVDPGDVAGETITVAALCSECSEVRAVAFTLPDDLTAPAIAAGPPVALSAHGIRGNPFDPFIASYEVAVQMQDVTDESAVFVRYEGDGVDVVRRLGNGFQVPGGIERTLCVSVTLFDVAGNANRIADEACVALDASTAAPLGELPQPVQ